MSMRTAAASASAKPVLDKEQTAAVLQSYDALAAQLRLPAAEQELHEFLILQPLRAFADEREDDTADDVVPSGDREEELKARHMRAVCMGALLMLLASLKTHQQLTADVLESIEAREEVVARLFACLERYDDHGGTAAGPGSAKAARRRGARRGPKEQSAGAVMSLDDAQQEILVLLQEHQMRTLVVVEAIFRWREQLSRPFPFNFELAMMRANNQVRLGGVSGSPTNYLAQIPSDCAVVTRSTLGQSLSLHLDSFPCSSNVDLSRVLLRKQLMQRARLINTGALLRDSVNGSAFMKTTATSRLAIPTPPPRRLPTAEGRREGTGPPQQRTRAKSQDASGASRESSSSAPRPLYLSQSPYLSGPPGLWARRKQQQQQQQQRQQRSRSGTRARADPCDSAGAEEGSGRRPFSPPTGLLQSRREVGASSRQQKHLRLLAAEAMLLREAAVQDRLRKELAQLASEAHSFVPLLPIAALVTADPRRSSNGGDTIPLEAGEWLDTVALDVDRCMEVAAAAFRLHEAESPRAQPLERGRVAADLADSRGSATSHSGTFTSSSIDVSTLHAARTGGEAAEEARVNGVRTLLTQSSPSSSSNSSSGSDSSGGPTKAGRRRSASASLEALRQQLLAERHGSSVDAAAATIPNANRNTSPSSSSSSSLSVKSRDSPERRHTPLSSGGEGRQPQKDSRGTISNGNRSASASDTRDDDDEADFYANEAFESATDSD